MSFQTLSDQFNETLSQYQNTYQDYINTLNSSNNSFITVPNYSFNGQNIINALQNSSVQNCQTSCSTNSLCAGASFNNSTSVCTLNSGNGNMISAQNITAIVQEGLYYSYQLQQLNAKLTQINEQMQSLASNSEMRYQKNQQISEQKAKILRQNYLVLNKERNEINEMVLNYETLNQAYEDGNLNATSNYYSYIALVLITILLVFLLVKFSLAGQQRGGGSSFKSETFFLLAIMVVFLGLSKIFNNYSIYMFVSILAIAYIIAKIKLNQ